MVGAYRCETCGINFPHGLGHRCPVHGTAMRWSGQLDPDADVLDKLAVILEQTEPEALPPLEDMVPVVETRVRVRNAELFVFAWDVYAAVRARLQPGALIRVGKQTFEVLEYLEELREYWVRPFSTDLSEEDLAGLAAG